MSIVKVKCAASGLHKIKKFIMTCVLDSTGEGKRSLYAMVQSAGAAEYTDCISAEG